MRGSASRTWDGRSVELVTGVIGAVLGVLGALLVQRSESKRLGRLAVSQDLYRKWQSLEMTEARSRAFVVLRRNGQEPNPLTFAQLAESIQPAQKEDWLAVSRVIHFFEECGTLLKADAADGNSLKTLLGRYVEYWHDGYLEPLWDRSKGTDPAAELHWFPPIAELRSRV